MFVSTGRDYFLQIWVVFWDKNTLKVAQSFNYVVFLPGAMRILRYLISFSSFMCEKICKSRIRFCSGILFSVRVAKKISFASFVLVTVATCMQVANLQSPFPAGSVWCPTVWHWQNLKRFSGVGGDESAVDSWEIAEWACVDIPIGLKVPLSKTAHIREYQKWN